MGVPCPAPFPFPRGCPPAVEEEGLRKSVRAGDGGAGHGRQRVGAPGVGRVLLPVHADDPLQARGMNTKPITGVAAVVVVLG